MVNRYFAKGRYFVRDGQKEYGIIIDPHIDSEENIQVTTQNSLILKGGWTDREILRLLDYIKEANSEIKIESFSKDVYFYNGYTLKKYFFGARLVSFREMLKKN